MLITKEITIYDLANELNISVATVSRGLKNDPAVTKKTRDKIFELAKKRGYRSNHVARNLRSQTTNHIGVIIGSKLTSNFQACAISGIENEANKRGYNIIVSQSSERFEKEASNVEMMFNSRVDGLLVSLSLDTKNLDHFESFFKRNIPVIFFDRVMEHEKCASVVIDNQGAGYKATRHLVEQGCRDIVHITAPLQQNVYIDRLKGYRLALEENGIAFKKENLIITSMSFESGVEAAETILKMPVLPDGAVVMNDNCAVSCMTSLMKKGVKIPDDIAFVGFNNDPVSTVVIPNLSTISYSGYDIGEAAITKLLDHLSGLSPIPEKKTLVLESDLVIRASSLRIHS